MQKTILVPIDGSENSNHAIEEAIIYAKGCQGKLLFLNVSNINQLAINACYSETVLEAITKAGEAILEQAMAMVPEGMEAERYSVTGSPAIEIIKFAKENEADVIVMGSRGLGVMKGMILGSVSQYVIEQAHCPVMVVK